MLKFLLFIILYPYLNFENAGKDVFVTISNGRIKGDTMISRGGRVSFSFRGIPYAEPPIGELRFKAPVEVSNWVGTFEATRNAPICLQKDFMFHGHNLTIEGSEDCLFLNVYTPTMEEIKKLPVIVLIHYGGFATGNSKSTLIGPHYFLDKDIVFVSFNYRLGVFGFYSTLDDASPGNYGLKDQLLVLRWVQKNIHKFGGNPNLVTIYGISAGAASAHYHLISPASQGLFHRIIASSGTALNLWGHPLNLIQQNFFRPAAETVGCNGTTTTKIIACMRKVSANDLLLLADHFKIFNNEPVMVFNIVHEKKSKLNPEPFLEENSLNLIKKGNFKKVPFIVGMTQEEGILGVAASLLQEDLYKRLRKEFDDLVPRLVLSGYETSKDKIRKLWKKIKEFYFKNKTISIEDSETIKGYIDLNTDAFFTYSFYLTALYHSYNGYEDLWVYNFGYKGEQSYRQSFASTNRTIDYDFGVSHLDDTIYLLPAADVLPELPSSDLKMSEIMVEIWTYFALHGEPPKLNDGFCSLDWKRMPNKKGKTPIKNEYLNFLNITKSLDDCTVSTKMQKGFLKERMNFWKNLDINFQIKDVRWE